MSWNIKTPGDYINGPLTVAGSATITGDLTVDTSTLKVDSANDRVGIGTATPSVALDVVGASAISGTVSVGTTTPLATGSGRGNVTVNGSTDAILAFGIAGVNSGFVLQDSAGMTLLSSGATYLRCYTNGSERYKIDSTGVATWSNVGGVAGTAMTLNSTGLGVGASPLGKFDVYNTGSDTTTFIRSDTTRLGQIVFRDNADSANQGRVKYDHSTDTLSLYSGGNENVFLSSSGNVGIGVTPSAGGTGFYKTFEIGKAGCGLFVSTAGLSSAENTYFSGNAVLKYNSGPEWSYGNAGSAGIYGIEDGVHKWYNATSGSAGGTFTPTQAMTLTAAGELLVGTASAGGVFDTKFYLSSNSGTNKWAVGPYGTATNFAIIPTPGTGGVYLSGTSATSWTAYSDERLKDIIEPITNALTKVGSLRSVIGKFKGDEANTRRPFLIAQDLQSALPEAVDASNPDRLGVAYTDVIPLLVAAIKELTAEVNALKNA